MKTNNRVYVVYSLDDDVVESFGLGTYLCQAVPDETAMGLMADFCRQQKREVPKIQLDSGEIIWGCECYFDSEEFMKKVIHGKEIKMVNIEELRNDYQRADSKD